jgi:hypothetical protein
VRARGQIENVEVEERIAVEQQEALLQQSGGVNQRTGVPSGACSSETARRARPRTVPS